MNNCPFCNQDPAADSGGLEPTETNLRDREQPGGLLRRAWRGSQWLFPATFLVLMPKCPFCVAAYVAMFTGIGITVSTARWIQVLMLVVCLTSLGYLAARYWRTRSHARRLTVSSSSSTT